MEAGSFKDGDQGQSRVSLSSSGDDRTGGGGYLEIGQDRAGPAGVQVKLSDGKSAKEANMIRTCLFFGVEVEEALANHRQKMSEIESQQRAIVSALESLVKANPKQALDKSEESAKLQKMLATCDQELEYLQEQHREFEYSMDCIIEKIGELRVHSDRGRYDLREEVSAFEEGLPIYGYKRRVQEAVAENDVTIIMAETGSGKSTQVARYLAQVIPSPKMIVCTQPRKIAAVSLASHVAQQMETVVGGFVGYKVGSQSKRSRDTKIMFMTDQMLLNECVKDQAFSRYACVILDEVHERSINTDLLLGLTKDALASNKKLKVVITSATMDSNVFFRHFLDDGIRVTKLDIPGRTFPIDIKWEPCPVALGRGYLQSVQAKTEEVLTTTTRGDILVFVATPADTNALCERLKVRTSEVEVYQLHGRLQIEEQRKIFNTGPRRRVIFSTNCAETSVTVPGIRYVIDSGVAKEVKFNPVQNSSSLEIQKINKSSAKQRAGRAGRTEAGVCYRMYSPEEFDSMRPDMVPEIKKVGLEQTVLKLLDLGIQEPHNFSYIESPGVENLQHATQTLLNLGAVEMREEKVCLTQLGERMAKLPLEPRLSKLVLLCIEAGLGEEGVRLSSMVSMSGNVFFRMGSEEELLQADQKKIAFSEDESDFLTLLRVYEKWSQVDERQKSTWCVENFVNRKSMRIARDVANDIRMALKHDCGIEIIHSNTQQDVGNRILLQLVFQCFKDNLCLFSGFHKLGYINVWTKEAFPVHPSSTFCYLNPPELVVYDRLLTTSRTFLLGVSSVDMTWLSPGEIAIVNEAGEEVVRQETIGPLGPRIIKQHLLGQHRKGLKQIESEVKELLPRAYFSDLKCNFESGSITWVSNLAHNPSIKALIKSKLDQLKEDLANECMSKNQPGNDQTTLLIGSEGELKDVVLSNEFLDIMINLDHLEMLDVARDSPGAYNAYRTKTKGWIVCFDSVGKAKKALKVLQENGGENCCYPLKRTSVRAKDKLGFEIRVKFRRRKLKDYAILKFDSAEECSTTRLSLLQESLLLKNGERISLGSKKQRDTASLFMPLSIRGQGPLQVLKSERPRDVIEEALKSRNLPFKEVFIPMEPPMISSDEIMQSINTNLKDIAEGVGIKSAEYSLHIGQRMPKDFFWDARIAFSNFNLGMALANHLRDIKEVSWKEGTTERKERMLVNQQATTEFSCTKRVFAAARGRIETALKELSSLCPMDSLQHRVTEFCAGSSNLESKRVVITLICPDMTTIGKAHKALEELMKGKTYDDPNVKLLLLPGNLESLKRVEEDSGALLERGQDDIVRIYGSNSQVAKAEAHISALLSKIVSDGYCTFIESLDKYPNGLVSTMLKKFGVDLQPLYDKEGVHDIKFLIQQRKLRIAASPEGFQCVLKELENIGKLLPEGGPLGDEESCPVCLSPPHDGKRLEHCGHMYCSQCLVLQIMSTTGPLQCSHQVTRISFALYVYSSCVRNAPRRWWWKTSNLSKMRKC